jgi:IS30 family transposase
MIRRWRRWSAPQRAELWARFKAGETLKEIAAALGRHPGTVQSVVEAAGGCAPRGRMRARWALQATERETLARHVETGAGVREMARLLGRAPSTISRELTRNGGRAQYRAFAADARAWQQAARPKPCRLAQCQRLRRLVARKLARGGCAARIPALRSCMCRPKRFTDRCSFRREAFSSEN